MKLRWIVVLAAGVLCVQAGCASGGAAAAAPAATRAAEEPVLKTPKERGSYALGVETGRNFKRQGMDIDPDLVTRGMNDVLKGNKLLLTDEELLDAMVDFTGRLIVQRGKERLTAGLDNKQEGEAFLAENKTKEGVVTLPSGLQYKVLQAGEGKRPSTNDTVECYFRGTLVDGTEFGSVLSPTPPASFKVSDRTLIPGLREALKLMPVGSKWQLFIPSQLAYGQRGAGGAIGPYTTLIYQVELVAIK